MFCTPGGKNSITGTYDDPRLWSHNYYKNGKEIYSVDFTDDGEIESVSIIDEDGFYHLTPNENDYIPNDILGEGVEKYIDSINKKLELGIYN